MQEIFSVYIPINMVFFNVVATVNIYFHKQYKGNAIISYWDIGAVVVKAM